MHYGGDFFTSDGSQTIVTKDPNYQGKIVSFKIQKYVKITKVFNFQGQRVGLSQGDIQRLNNLYNC